MKHVARAHCLFQRLLLAEDALSEGEDRWHHYQDHLI